MQRTLSRTMLALLATTVVALVACDGTLPTNKDGPTILSGMVAGESNDTIANTPPPQAPPTPGSFHGFVLGHGTGPDTMATAPRLAGVVITAYPHLGWSGPNPMVGDAVATRTSDANGAFQFPTMAGGDYVVTFEAPASSAYGATFVTTTIHSSSNDGNWWVILPLKP